MLCTYFVFCVWLCQKRTRLLFAVSSKKQVCKPSAFCRAPREFPTIKKDTGKNKAESCLHERFWTALKVLLIASDVKPKDMTSFTTLFAACPKTRRRSKMGFSVPAAACSLIWSGRRRVATTEEFPSDTPLSVERWAPLWLHSQHFPFPQQVTHSTELKMLHILCLDKTPNKNTRRLSKVV